MKQNSTPKKKRIHVKHKRKMKCRKANLKKKIYIYIYYVISRQNTFKVIRRILPRFGRTPIKNYIRRMEKNATFLYQLTQHKVTHFLLVALCSVQTACSLLCATPNGSLQHRLNCLSGSAHHAQNTSFLQSRCGLNKQSPYCCAPLPRP